MAPILIAFGIRDKTIGPRGHSLVDLLAIHGALFSASSAFSPGVAVSQVGQLCSSWVGLYEKFISLRQRPRARGHPEYLSFYRPPASDAPFPSTRHRPDRTGGEG